MLALLALVTLPVFIFFPQILECLGVDSVIAEQAGVFTRVVFPGLALKMQSTATQEFFKLQ